MAISALLYEVPGEEASEINVTLKEEVSVELYLRKLYLLSKFCIVRGSTPKNTRKAGLNQLEGQIHLMISPLQYSTP